MTDEITPQTQQTLPKKDDKKQQPSNGSAQQGGNKQAPKKNGPTSRSTSVSAGAGNARPSSRSSNRSSGRKPSNAQGAADSGSESANARRNNNSGEGRQRGKSQSGRGGGQQGGGGHKKGQSTSQGNRGQGGGNRPKQPSPNPPATSESSDALSSLQRVIADLKTTSPPNQQGNVQSLAAASTLPANAPVFQPGAHAFPSSGLEQPPRHRKAASLGASSLGGGMAYSPNLGSMMEDAEDGQGTPIIEEGEIPENGYQTGHQRRSLSQSFNPPRFQALAAQQQQEQSDVVGPTGRPQLAPNFMFGARRRPASNLAMGPPINEEDVGFQFPQQTQNNFGNLEDSHRKPDDRGDISGIMAEQVSARSDCESSVRMPTSSPTRSPSRPRLRRCSSSNRPSTSNSSPRTRCSPSRPPVSRLAVMSIAVSTAPLSRR